MAKRMVESAEHSVPHRKRLADALRELPEEHRPDTTIVKHQLVIPPALDNSHAHGPKLIRVVRSKAFTVHDELKRARHTRAAP